MTLIYGLSEDCYLPPFLVHWFQPADAVIYMIPQIYYFSIQQAESVWFLSEPAGCRDPWEKGSEQVMREEKCFWAFPGTTSARAASEESRSLFKCIMLQDLSTGATSRASQLSVGSYRPLEQPYVLSAITENSSAGFCQPYCLVEKTEQLEKQISNINV